MTKKNNTTKTVETMVKEIVETPIAAEKNFTIPPISEAAQTNTNSISNLNQGFKKNPKASTTYRLYKERKDRKTGKTKFPIVHMLKAEDIIFDSEKGVNRKIRYIPGEPSIFEDEQKKDSMVKSPITFSNGL